MRSFLTSLTLLLLATPAVAQTALHDRAGELVPIINGQGDVPKSFAPSFLSAISEADLRALAARLVEQLGRAWDVADLVPTGASKADLHIRFEHGVAEAEIVIAPAGARQITGLRITGTQSDAVAQLASLDLVAKEFAKLPGRAGFIAIDLDAKTPAASLAPDQPIGIGSTFKLIILAEIVRGIEAGERHWDDLVPIDGAELPSGAFHDLPVGSQIPLRGLAEAMIKVSDNSATDVLIRLLTREKIEAMQARLGLTDANVPFLTTLEAFKLKGLRHGTMGTRYLSLDPIARRAMLDDELAKVPASEIGSLFADGRPVMVDRIEWFASPQELAKVMGWFKAHDGTAAGQEALRIMAINPGPVADLADRFAYVGYKGGSEPGLLSMTLLLQDKRQRWHVISGSWTDPNAPVDELRFASLIRRAAELSLDRP